MNTAIDVVNLSPSVPLDGDIPEEVWSRKKASYNHLKVFGCRDVVFFEDEITEDVKQAKAKVRISRNSDPIPSPMVRENSGDDATGNNDGVGINVDPESFPNTDQGGDPEESSESDESDVGYHWIWEVFEERHLLPEKVHIDDNWSDIMTEVEPTKMVEGSSRVPVWLPPIESGRGRLLGSLINGTHK